MPLAVGDTLTMPNGGVGIVTQIQGDHVTAGPFEWPGQRPVAREVFFNGTIAAALTMRVELSSEAGLLRRLAEKDPDSVEPAVTDMGPGIWQDAYRELHPK